jgi:hypothetical protein
MIRSNDDYHLFYVWCFDRIEHKQTGHVVRLGCARPNIEIVLVRTSELNVCVCVCVYKDGKPSIP